MEGPPREPDATSRWMRISGERHLARTTVEATGVPAALAYVFADARVADAIFEPLGWTILGSAPVLVRPLRLSFAAERLLPTAARGLVPNVPLVAPFGGKRRTGVREITTFEPRFTRLWDRFCIDIGVAIDRNAAYFGRRIFDRPEGGYRVFIFEDGDRYAVRAMCIFTVKDGTGYVMELLHDRSVTGMRAASHLLGIAVREMSDAGAEAAVAWSLTHSGSFPIYARHAFVSPPAPLRTKELRFGACAFDDELADIVTKRDRWYLSYLDADEGV